MERGKGDCKLCLEQIGRAQNRFNKHGQIKIKISDPPSSLSARLVVVNRSVSLTGRGPRTPETRNSCTPQVIEEVVWLVVCTRSTDSSAGGGRGCSPHCLWDYANDTNRTGQPPHSSSHLSPLLRRLWSVSSPPSVPLSPDRRGFPSSAEIHTFIDLVSLLSMKALGLKRTGPAPCY